MAITMPRQRALSPIRPSDRLVGRAVCLQCGVTGHQGLTRGCPYRVVECARCGRRGHTYLGCNAETHTRGYRLPLTLAQRLSTARQTSALGALPARPPVTLLPTPPPPVIAMAFAAALAATPARSTAPGPAESSASAPGRGQKMWAWGFPGRDTPPPRFEITEEGDDGEESTRVYYGPGDEDDDWDIPFTPPDAEAYD